jgi:large subunit ribosomal protein L29
MKPVEIRELESEELHARIAELKEELFNLRFQLATGQLDNHRRMRDVRRDVARIRTILRERDYAFAERTAAQAVPAAEPPAPAAEPPAPAAPAAEEPAEEAT